MGRESDVEQCVNTFDNNSVRGQPFGLATTTVWGGSGTRISKDERKQTRQNGGLPLKAVT